MLKSIRLIFYIAVAVIMIIAIQIQKSKIIKSRKDTPSSVLGILSEKGVPVETYVVEEKDITETLNTTLEKCGSNWCFYLSRSLGKNLRKGDPIFDINEGKKIGSITIVNGTDPLTGLVKATVNVTEKSESKKSDFHIVSVGISQIKDTLAIPAKSIEYGTDATYVWVFNDGQPKKQVIKTGAKSDDFVQVKSGLRKGDVIVKSGQGLLYQYNKAFQIQNAEADVSVSNAN